MCGCCCCRCCYNRTVQLIFALCILLYSRSLYYDRFKLRSFPFVAKVFFPMPSLNFKQHPNKIAVVTGANSGLGLASTQQLAEHGVHVIMACRNIEKCNTAKLELMDQDTHYKLTCMLLDLSSFRSVQLFSMKYLKMFNRLDILMLNGGIIAPHSMTIDHIEKTFQVNYLSHFLLAQLLLPMLQRNPNQHARIVSVSSDAHSYSYKEGILGSWNNIDNMLSAINNENRTNMAQNYAQAKLANIMMTKEMTNRLQEDSVVYINAAHPGFVATNLFYNSFRRYGLSHSISSIFQYYVENVMTFLNIAFDMHDGALTQVYAALSDDIIHRNYRGLFFVPIAGLSPNHQSVENKTLTAMLYDMSMNIIHPFLTLDNIKI